MKKIPCFLLIVFSLCFTQEIGARYLIITHDDFHNDIQPLAEWKHRKGLRTKVVTLSQIGSSASQIKTYIQQAYDTWQIRPEFLLLVGAPNFLPWGSFGPYSDNYYMEMTGDLFNDILAGRLTVHNNTEAQTVINKILRYEKTPDMSDSLWFINACLIVRNDYDPDDSIYWSDIHHAKNFMIQNSYNIIDTLASEFGNNANDILQAVDLGRAFVLYRGRGVGNWYSPFAVNPDETQNGTKLPIVLSITSATIGSGSTPATAERWLLTGTPSLSRGGAGYFAGTNIGSNIAHLRSAVCKGFFDAIFQEGKRTFGEACEGGRMNVYNLYGSTSEYRGFTTLGDPEMNIWTAIPRLLGVFHDSTLSTIDDSLTIEVLCNSIPVDSAFVCVVLDTLVYEYGYTSSTGSITLYFDTLYQGFMDITVTARNKIPYLDSILVLSTDVGEESSLKTIDHASISITPNPFCDETWIVYTLPQNSERMIIEIFAVDGRRVMKFTPSEPSGVIIWQGDDDRGQSLAAGVYFVELETDSNTHTKKVILLD